MQFTQVARNREIGDAGRRCYEQRYSPAAAAAVYDRLLLPTPRGAAGT